MYSNALASIDSIFHSLESSRSCVPAVGAINRCLKTGNGGRNTRSGFGGGMRIMVVIFVFAVHGEKSYCTHRVRVGEREERE